jgi:hypothetical protein
LSLGGLVRALLDFLNFNRLRLNLYLWLWRRQLDLSFGLQLGHLLFPFLGTLGLVVLRDGLGPLREDALSVVLSFDQGQLRIWLLYLLSKLLRLGNNLPRL